MVYTESFKAKMAQRMSGPNAVSQSRLSREVGVRAAQGQPYPHGEVRVMSQDLWRAGVVWRDVRPDGTIRHSQITSTYGPGALVEPAVTATSTTSPGSTSFTRRRTVSRAVGRFCGSTRRVPAVTSPTFASRAAAADSLFA